MWLLSNLRAAEPVILVGAWMFLFVAVPAASVLAAKVQSKR
jgi:hypothetical protein